MQSSPKEVDPRETDQREIDPREIIPVEVCQQHIGILGGWWGEVFLQWEELWNRQSQKGWYDAANTSVIQVPQSNLFCTGWCEGTQAGVERGNLDVGF